MQMAKAGLLYFALVFGTGFLLGPIRLLWLVPRFGTRIAELMEMPVMLVVIVLAARWTVRGTHKGEFLDQPIRCTGAMQRDG